MKDKPTQYMQDCVHDALLELGLDLESEGMLDTPRRFCKYLLEFCQPFDPEEILGKNFNAGTYKGMVVQSRIPFKGLCEHHLAPMMGYAAIGYIPNDRVVGLSKLTRLVNAVGRERPSIQEHMTQRIADILDNFLNPKGVIVVIEAEHGCMACRGVSTSGIITTTSSIHGVYRDVPQARDEFFRLVARVEVHQ